MKKTQVVIVGGGVSGIACARVLQERGIEFILVEQGESLGGRVRSEREGGFIFDRGFQVFNSAYRYTKELLAGSAISFQSFRAGALIRTAGRFVPLCDPFREPGLIWKTLTAHVGTFADKLKILAMRRDACRGTLGPDRAAIEELRARRFSSDFLDRFLIPLFEGIFLEHGLNTCSVSLQHVLRDLSTGVAQLPCEGMGEVPQAMARPLIQSRILLGRRATEFSNSFVRLDDGSEIRADGVVSALDVDSLRRIHPELPLPKSLPVCNLYFEGPRIPEISRFLVLGTGAINTLVDLSSISAGYAPAGRALISVAVLGTEPREVEVMRELNEWFPGVALNHLRTILVSGALPCQRAPFGQFDTSGFHIAGDFLAPASIEGAVKSGIKIGTEILR